MTICTAGRGANSTKRFTAITSKVDDGRGGAEASRLVRSSPERAV